MSVAYGLHGFIIFVAILYILFLTWLFVGLNRLKPACIENPASSVAVIIPARNEESSIEACVLSVLHQNYPEQLYHIYVVDDHSTDQTAKIASRMAARFPGRITVLQLSEAEQEGALSFAYKKRAISYAIERANEEIIATTDADCIVQPNWLSTLVSHYDAHTAMVYGFVLYKLSDGDSLFQRIQALEHLSLMAIGAGSAGMSHPLVNSAANLSYRKSVFHQVDGFNGIDNLPSGDDDLLLHKIQFKTDYMIKFMPESKAATLTFPAKSLGEFFNQRIRWASKSLHYQNRLVTALQALVYLFYLYLTVGVLYSLFADGNYILPIILLSLKALADLLVMLKTCRMVRRLRWLIYFPVAEIFQIFYILVAGFLGVFGSYNWKGRKIGNRR